MSIATERVRELLAYNNFLPRDAARIRVLCDLADAARYEVRGHLDNCRCRICRALMYLDRVPQ